MRKIALIGTGPGWEKAPFNSDWETWTIAGLHDRCEPDRVYEIHSGKQIAKGWVDCPIPQKMAWLKRQKLYIHPTLKTTFPDGIVFDYQRHLDKFGNYFTSSISWMLADAIEEKPDEIGIFGVSMSSTGEYGHQKPGCTYLIGWARASGIKVTIQEGSELLAAPYIYGLEEPPLLLESLANKKEEILKKKNVYEERFNGAMCDHARAEGYLECIEFIENNFWSGSKG